MEACTNCLQIFEANGTEKRGYIHCVAAVEGRAIVREQELWGNALRLNIRKN